jgi:hypothetical protein
VRPTTVNDRFQPLSGIGLVDQFGSGTVDVKRPASLCLPTDEMGGDPTAPSHAAHLESYLIKGPHDPPQTNVKIVNQFGTIFVDAFRADRLLVPTTKSLVATPPLLPTPVVDHFECYKSKVTKDTPKFDAIGGVTLEDQFGTQTVLVKKPSRLCTPVDVNGGDPSAPGHPDHLMCYRIKAPRFARITSIFVNNEFGPGTLDAFKPAELCVPSLKNP